MANDLKTILIVEDVVTERLGWQELMEGNGFRVLSARDELDGYDILKHKSVHLVILDLSFPTTGREAGFRFLAKKSHSRHSKDIPVIIITGMYTEQRVKNRVRRYVDVKSILEKPVDNRILLQAVNSIFNR